MIEDHDYVVRVASKYYKGPELFVGYQKYEYSLDMWSLGCIVATIIFMIDPFFRGDKNEDMVASIVRVMGFQEFHEYLRKYKIKYSHKELVKLRMLPCKRWSKFYQTKYIDRVTTESLDLLDSLLVIDHRHRISARQALLHPYFGTFFFYLYLFIFNDFFPIFLASVRCIYGNV